MDLDSISWIVMLLEPHEQLTVNADETGAIINAITDERVFEFQSLQELRFYLNDCLPDGE